MLPQFSDYILELNNGSNVHIKCIKNWQSDWPEKVVFTVTILVNISKYT